MLWLEEPLPAGDLAGMRMLREQTGIRVAGGEMARTPAELLDAISAGALDVVQPDAVLAVGHAPGRTIAEFALLRHRWFTPHTWTNGLGLLANLHVVAGVGGGPYVEYPYDPPGWTRAAATSSWPSRCWVDAGGCLAVPAGPASAWRSMRTRSAAGHCPNSGAGQCRPFPPRPGSIAALPRLERS